MIQPNQPIAVTLTAEQWNQVIAVMAAAPVPYRISAPLIQEIQQQCMAQSAQVPTNGVGEEARDA